MTLNRTAIIRSLLTLVAAFLFSYLLTQGLWPSYRQVELENAKPTWIAPSTSSFAAYFRREFFLNSKADNAWIKIAAAEGFELIVNGDSVGKFNYWRPTRPFQNGLSTPGQKISNTPPAISLNYPREYQWQSHKSHLLPIYFDIAPFLKSGQNVVALRVESRKPQAAFFADGKVSSTTDGNISLKSGNEWLAITLPEKIKGLHWSQTNYLTNSWKPARIIRGPSQKSYKSFAPAIFTSSFEARNIGSGKASGSLGLWFNKDWIIDSVPKRAWIRLHTNRPYSLFINGRIVKTPISKPEGFDQGGWLLKNNRSRDLPSLPELLDPDEVGEYFSGDKFKSPRHSDPTLNEFNPTTATRDQSPGIALEKEEKRRAPDAVDPLSYRPDNPKPLSSGSLKKNETFIAYSVAPLLKPGKNTISIRLDNQGKFSSRPFIALDSEGSLQTDSSWQYQEQSEKGTKSDLASVSSWTASSSSLPRKRYGGLSYSVKDLIIVQASYFLLSLALLALVGIGLRRISDSRQIARSRFMGFILGLGVFSSSPYLLESAFFERSERLLFMQPSFWLLFALFAFLLSLAISLRLGGRSDTLSKLRKSLSLSQRLSSKLSTNTILSLSLLLAFFLRAYRLEFQALDDDEYASTQAILSIAKTGVPSLSEGIYYTRSPLYHYLVAIVVKIFGENIWALRLPSVLFGVATAYLVFHLCKQLFSEKSKAKKTTNGEAIGLVAAIIFTLHPFAIYSSHIARFYQQQQFFYLLSVYLFVQAFIKQSSQRLAYYCLGSFLLAVLSQEISVILGVQIGLAYLLFSKRKYLRDELRLLVFAIGIVSLIAVDLLIFKTRCLSAATGVSPNQEATLAFNLGSPMNYFALFLAYSRLHVVLSFFFFSGIAISLLRKTSTEVKALYFFTLSGVVLTNLLVTGVSLRYQYSLFPLFICLSVFGAWQLKDIVAAYLEKYFGDRHSWFSKLLLSVSVALMILSLSPWRIPDSYSSKILGDSSGALGYVRENKRADDKVAITEPHPHAAYLELGKADYDLAIPILYDFTYSKSGVLVDRNAGARVIGNIADLQNAVKKHDRLWVIVNREKFRSRNKNIRWEYPGARVELFLRQNFEVKYETYLWTVFLWDVSRGQYRSFSEL